jgi:hypothetical protein
MTTPRRILFAALTLLGAAALPALAHPNQAQFQAAVDKAFAEADADGSGSLSPDEFAVFHDALRRAFEAARFAKIDTNGDGQLSREELAAAPPPHHHCGPAPE